MTSFVDKLKGSVPTLTQEQSLAMVQSIFAGEAYKLGFVMFSSALSGFDVIVQMAETYTLSLSTVNSSHESYQTSHPAHVLHAASEEFSIEFWGLLYSNGFILYSENLTPGNTDEPMLFLWIHKEIADLFEISYIDTVQQKFYNSTPEEFIHTLQVIDEAT